MCIERSGVFRDVRKILTELGPKEFNGRTLKRGGTLAAVFLASWCPFCRRFKPAFEAAANTNDISWATVDLSDDENELWDVFDIQIVPTVLVFKDGNAVWRKDGEPGRGLSDDVINETVSKVRSLAQN